VRRRDDAGLSLVELTISMMIVSVLAIAIGGVTITSFRALRIAQVRVSTAADARVAMEAISRNLRVAVTPVGQPSAIMKGDVGEVRFYALLSRTTPGNTTPAPTFVEYYRQNNCVMEDETPASGPGPVYTWPPGGRTSRCLVRTTQVPTSAAPLFSYYDSSQLQSNGSSATPLTVPTDGNGLTPTQRVSVVSVGVTLTVIDPANPTVAGATDQAQVTLDNVSLAAPGGTA
jgi:type II secretory pathway pseudopilin PulG